MSNSDQQAELERIVTRVAQRAANNAAGGYADLCTQLALSQETADGLNAALTEQKQQVTEKDAELERTRLAGTELRRRVEELEAELAALRGAGDDSPHEDLTTG